MTREWPFFPKLTSPFRASFRTAKNLHGIWRQIVNMNVCERRHEKTGLMNRNDGISPIGSGKDV
jgi:hypothetical protein